MLQVSVSDLKVNPSKYVDLAQSSEVGITRNGKIVARIVPVRVSKATAARELIGILLPDTDYDRLREERILS